MDLTVILKLLSDKTRLGIVELLLKKRYCVRALSGKLGISESAVSQHIKLLKDSGLLQGEKRGYFMHYMVNREMLHELAGEIEALAMLECEECTPASGDCSKDEGRKCHSRKSGKWEAL